MKSSTCMNIYMLIRRRARGPKCWGSITNRPISDYSLITYRGNVMQIEGKEPRERDERYGET
jgi:hypothetical protein